MGIDDVNQIDIAAPLPDLQRREEEYLQIQPGRVTELVGVPGKGLTRLGLKLLAEAREQRAQGVARVRGRGVGPLEDQGAFGEGVEAGRGGDGSRQRPPGRRGSSPSGW